MTSSLAEHAREIATSAQAIADGIIAGEPTITRGDVHLLAIEVTNLAELVAHLAARFDKHSAMGADLAHGGL
jgi:hypothetical protein